MTPAIEAMQKLEQRMHKKYGNKPMSKYVKQDLLNVIKITNELLDETATHLFIAERRLEEAGL